MVLDRIPSTGAPEEYASLFGAFCSHDWFRRDIRVGPCCDPRSPRIDGVMMRLGAAGLGRSWGTAHNGRLQRIHPFLLLICRRAYDAGRRGGPFHKLCV